MAYADEVLADSPNAYWKMNEASGLIADTTANGNSATTQDGTPTYQAVGPITSGSPNYAITFASASSQDFTVDDSATLDVGDVFTLEGWGKRASSGVNHFFFARDTNGYAMTFESDKLTTSKVNVSIIVQSTITITDTLWHHCVVTKNGATVKLYIDGVDVTGTVTNATIVDNANPLLIASSGAANFFNGGLAHLAIYPTALSAARVLAHYNAATSAAGSAADNPPIGILGRGAGW